jgi:SAM-dependent methyltransferase
MTNKVVNVAHRDRKRVDGPASRVAPQRLADALRAGRCPADRAFDRFLPDSLRVISVQYWTPLVVAKRAAEWFDELKVRTVVDIGSGAGKFCVAAALVGHCRFTGLEQRPRLVDSARALARLFDVDDRVSFVEGALGSIATPVADAYYLYNPFGEYLSHSHDQLEEGERSDARYARDVAAVQHLLHRARFGTCVLTYNGFGGHVPPSYRQIRVDNTLSNPLHLWRKERSRRRDVRRLKG